jgi:hypothetical protein
MAGKQNTACHSYTMRLPEQTAIFLTMVVVISLNAVGLSDLNGICSLSHVFTSSNYCANLLVVKETSAERDIDGAANSPADPM